MGSFFNGASRKKPRYQRLPLDTFYTAETAGSLLSNGNEPDEDNLLFDAGESGPNGRLLPSAPTAAAGGARSRKGGYDSEEEIEFYPDSRRGRGRGGGVAVVGRRAARGCRLLTARGGLLCLLILLLIAVVFFGALYISGPRHAPTFLDSAKGKTEWSSSTLPYGSETALRLYDVNLDGVQDVIMGAARTVSLDDVADREKFCKKINMSNPCIGLIMALDGKNGARLWTLSTHMEVYAIQCGKLDINGDGHPDCIAAGRMGMLSGFDPLKGASLWSADPSITNPYFNYYQGQVVPDLNQDGVPEFVVTHGGDTRRKNTDTHRAPGRLLLLSGKTGRSLGRFVTLPDGHETYSAITLYRRQNGAIFLLFGSGGETIEGYLWTISLRDLYCYVKSIDVCDVDHLFQAPALQLPGYQESWGTPLHTLPSGVMEIIRSGSSKGVTIPTELVDMNGDGVDDILVLMYNSTLVLLDGRDLQVIWTTGMRFALLETYSNPAPGYFNDDNTLDIMVRLSEGRWPDFKWTYVYVLDGRNGEVLWHLKTPGDTAIMSSPITIQSQGRKDAFLFWAAGLQARVFDQGRRPRHDDDDDEGPMKGDPCAKDMAIVHADLLLLDRDLAMSPLRLATTEASMYNYSLTQEEKNHSPDEPEGPVVLPTAPPDLHVTTASRLSSPRTDAGTGKTVTEEDLARHDLLGHSTAETVTTPWQQGKTTGAVTTPEGVLLTTLAISTPRAEATTGAATSSPGAVKQTTEAVTTPAGGLPSTTQAVTTPQGGRSTTEAATTMPEGLRLTTEPEAITTAEKERTTVDATTAPHWEGVTANATNTSESAGSNLKNSTSEIITSNRSTTDSDTSDVSTRGTMETSTQLTGSSQSDVKTDRRMVPTTVIETSVDLTTVEVTEESAITDQSEVISSTTTELTTADSLVQETTTQLASPESSQTTQAREDSTLPGKNDVTPQQKHTRGPDVGKRNGTSAENASAVVEVTQPSEEPETQTVEMGLASADATEQQNDDSRAGSTVSAQESTQDGQPTSDGTPSSAQPTTAGVEDGGAVESRRRRREIPGSDLCTIFVPTLFGTGILGDLDGDNQLDYIYTKSHLAQVFDDRGMYLTLRPRLSVHKLALKSAIKRRDWVKLGGDQAGLVDGVHTEEVTGEEVDSHFRFLPAKQQSWTSYMGQEADGKFRKASGR